MVGARLLIGVLMFSSTACGMRAGWPKALRKYGQDCGLKVRGYGLTQINKNPGAGVHPGSIVPFETVLKDGFLETACVKDTVFEYGDKFGKNKFSYKLGERYNVSIVRYSETVPKEDREKMNHDVCFRFCRTIPDMGFFGLAHGRDCYCAPFYQAEAGDSSDCDQVCEGGGGAEMCGGKTKSLIFTMHLCQDTKKELKAASNQASFEFGRAMSVGEAATAVADGMQDAAAKLQGIFGKTGDTVTADIMQVTKVWAGEVQHAEKDMTKAADALDVLVGDAGAMYDNDFSESKAVTAAEDLTANIASDSRDTSDLVHKAFGKYSEATRGFGRSGRVVQYYPIMYFVNKKYVDVPTTCGGDWDQKTIYGVTKDECAAACDAETVDPECQGFEHFEEGGLCMLFSKFESVLYYTGCPGAEPQKDSLLQAPVLRGVSSASANVSVALAASLRSAKQPAAVIAPEAGAGRYVKLSFSGAEVGNNNLGGLGPNKGNERIKYKSVGTVDGRSIDCIVTATGYEKSDKPKIDNGLDGLLGTINFAWGSDSTLTFAFQHSDDGSEATLGQFDFTVFDMDNPISGDPVQETFKLGGYKSVHMGQNAEITAVKTKDGRTKYTSMAQGSACDNPDDPNDLKTVVCKGNTIDQTQRAVGFRFDGLSQFEMQVKIKCLNKRECDASRGRNLLFAFSSAMIPEPAEPAKKEKMATPEKSKIETTTEAPKEEPPEGFGMAGCYVRFEDFNGVNLNPDPSGKCELCLKEATEAARCYM